MSTANAKLRVCFWSTSFAADTQALAIHLAQHADFEVLVAMDDPERYCAQAVQSLLPYRGALVDRRGFLVGRKLAAFDPDILIVDNHLPKKCPARRVFVLWHGFGWRVDDVSQMRKQLKVFVGDTGRSNPGFRWQAFGDWDRDYRVAHSGLHEDNVVALGSAYSDLLRPDSAVRRQLDRSRIHGHYDINLRRKTVLLGMTWHHGGALAHWGDDATLHQRLVEHIGDAGANVLIRMHDRQRYEQPDIERMERLASGFDHVQLSFKSEAPDSLVDLLLSDVVVSNYSSLLNAFYYTRRPTIHIHPVAESMQPQFHRHMKGGRVRKQPVDDPMRFWKLSPQEVGGLRATCFDELLSGIDRALSQPDCCADLASAFIDRYITREDGNSCERIAQYLLDWTRA